MLYYMIRKSSAANYTPRSLIFEIARAGRLPIVDLDKYGTVGLAMNGKPYCFDYWMFESNGDGTDTVHFYLKEAEATA